MRLFSRSFLAMGMRFGVVGGTGFLCNFLILSAAVLFLRPLLAEIIAVAVALQVTFFLHDKWTYTVDRAEKPLYKRYFQYIASNLVGACITVLVFALCEPRYSHLVALVIGTAAGLVWNFLFNMLIVWRVKIALTGRKPVDPADSAPVHVD